MACNPQKAKLNTERPAISETHTRAIRTRSYKEERPMACNQLKRSPADMHLVRAKTTISETQGRNGRWPATHLLHNYRGNLIRRNPDDKAAKEERPTACNQLKGSPVKHHVKANALSHYDSIARRCREILGPCAVPESPSRETDCVEITRGARVVNIAIVNRPIGTSIGGRRNRLSEEPFSFSFGFLGRPP